MKVSQQNTFVEVFTLQMIEMVFAGIEQSRMQNVPASHLITEIQEKLSEFRKSDIAQSAGNSVAIEQTETYLFEKLELWRKSLIERDQKFTAFDLRSFCSNTLPRFEHDVYAALAGFYWNLTPTVLVLSKFDYVVTQYFSREGNGNQCALRMSSEKIVAELYRLNNEWNDGKSNAIPSKSEIRESISALSELSSQAKTHKTLESWLENKFFDRSRETKRRLGETFFVPEVTAAVILCNLIVNNHFAALCEADSAMLNNAAGILVKDKGAQDLISSQLNSSFQTLLHSGLEEDFAEVMAHESLSNLFNLISDEAVKKEVLAAQPLLSDEVLSEAESLVDSTKTKSEAAETETLKEVSEPPSISEVETVPTQDAVFDKSQNNLNNLNLAVNPLPPSTNQTNANHAASSTVQSSVRLSAVANVLSELNRLNPDATVIKSYLEKSAIPEMRDLKFKAILDAETETGDKNLRRVLQLIIGAEETMRIAQSGDKALSTRFYEELRSLKGGIKSVDEYLRRSLENAAILPKDNDKRRKEYFETLLYATNTLAEVQIRLHSKTIALQNTDEKKPSAEVENNIEDQETFEKIKIETSEYRQTQVEPVVKPRLTKWLLIAAAIVLVAGVLSIFNLTTTKTLITNADVRALDPKTLRGGNAVLTAKISKKTLYSFVDKDWDSQTPDQKKDNLKLLLDEGSKHGFSSVLLFNQNGRLLGNASEAEIKIF